MMETLFDELYEQVTTAGVEPYMNLYVTQLQGKETTSAFARIATLPMQERYVWRILRALELAFGDYDVQSVRLDLLAMAPEDISCFREAIERRCSQFRLLIDTLTASTAAAQEMTVN